MSTWGNVLAGGLVGFGKAVADVTEDREKSEERQRLEKMRADAEEQRQLRLEELRSKNAITLAGVQHGNRLEEVGLQGSITMGTEAMRETAQNARHKDDVGLRERDLASRAADREQARALGWAQVGVHKQQLADNAEERKTDNARADKELQLRTDIATGNLGPLAKLPEAERLQIKNAQERASEYEKAYVKALSDPMMGADHASTKAIAKMRDDANAGLTAMFDKHGLLPKAEPKAKPAPTDDVISGTRKLIEGGGIHAEGARAKFISEYGQDAANRLLGAPNVQSATPSIPARVGGAVDGLVNRLTPNDATRIGQPRDVQLSPAEEAQRKDMDAARQRDADNVRRKAEMNAKIARIGSMSPQEAEEMLKEYSTSLPAKARLRLQALVR